MTKQKPSRKRQRGVPKGQDIAPTSSCMTEHVTEDTAIGIETTLLGLEQHRYHLQLQLGLERRSERRRRIKENILEIKIQESALKLEMSELQRDGRVLVNRFVCDIQGEKLKMEANQTLLNKMEEAVIDHKIAVALKKRQGLTNQLEGEDLSMGGRFAAISDLVSHLLMMKFPTLPSNFSNCGSFIECTYTFFTNLINAKESANWLLFEDLIPGSKSLKKLFIRASFKSIIQQFEGIGDREDVRSTEIVLSSTADKRLRKAMITGTPGIGKSLFLIYYLFKLVQAKRRVLFVYQSDIVYFDSTRFLTWTGLNPPARWVKDPNRGDLWNNDIYCLFDCKYKTKADLAQIPTANCHMLLSTSPRRSIINDFRKDGHTHKFYMPIWQLKEMHQIAHLFDPRKEWVSEYDILGGIPRTVFERHCDIWGFEPSAEELIESNIKMTALNEILKLIEDQSVISDHSKFDLHKVVHLYSVHPYQAAIPLFASEYVVNQVCERYLANQSDLCNEIISNYEKNEMTGQLAGKLFEREALRIIATGGVFKCYKIDSAGITSDSEQIISISPSKLDRVVKVEDNQVEFVLYAPICKRYAGIDAWIHGVGGFQITLNMQHTLNKRVKNDLPKLGKGSHKLFWVVREQDQEDFRAPTPEASRTGQNFKYSSLEQYLLLLPDPMKTRFENLTSLYVPK